jgi:molybdopterin converting factor small subunit
LVRDEVPFQGPVGGIYYGLRAAAGEFCFVTSCDAAFLNLRLISNLLSQISDHDVVVPYWENRFQPLHAVYRRSVLPLLAAQLERGELRPVFLYDKVRTRKITEEEIRRYDPDGFSFFNMNSPADYEIAVKRWNESGPGMAATRPLPLLQGSVSVTVELFGVARLITKTRSVALSLPEEASLADLLTALAARLPILVGRVIEARGAALVQGYACNLNGLNFVRSPSARINSGDKVFILSADAGG